MRWWPPGRCDGNLTTAGKGQLITAALLGIAVVAVILISVAKWHPFALIRRRRHGSDWEVTQ